MIEPNLPSWCGVRTTLTEDEFATLDAIPDGDHMVERDTWCEIQEDHPGPHMTLGQASGGQEDGQEMWLMWDDRIRELHILPPCEVIDEESTNQCVLPLDHPGRCAFCLD